MRIAISENVWELLIATFLLVVVIGIFSYYLRSYLCETKIAQAKVVVTNIFNRIKTWKESGIQSGVVTISCSELSESGCDVSVVSEVKYEEVEITCKGGCKYSYKINGISGINFQLDDECQVVSIEDNNGAFTITEISNKQS